MAKFPLITLASDFGTQDGYVASMKGVILQICPDANIVDVSHDLQPFVVEAASFVIAGAYRYYPPEAIHVAIVDPGVGTRRRPILLDTPNGIFLAPDNGLLTHVLLANEAEPTVGNDSPSQLVELKIPIDCKAYRLDEPKYWLGNVSSTFHGRDIFAPVAAHIASGVVTTDVGTRIESVLSLNLQYAVHDGNATIGRVVHVDRFGNLVTNIKPRLTDGVLVNVKGNTIEGLSVSYKDREGLLAIIGSHGYLEVAVTEGDAAEYLGAHVGDVVSVTYSGG